MKKEKKKENWKKEERDKENEREIRLQQMLSNVKRSHASIILCCSSRSSQKLHEGFVVEIKYYVIKPFLTFWCTGNFNLKNFHKVLSLKVSQNI